MASYQYGSIRSTTSARHSDCGSSVGREIGVARSRRSGGVAVVERRRRDVVGAAPDLHLLVAELRRRLLLVLALQRAVVPLVEPPRPPHRDPRAVAARAARARRCGSRAAAATCARRRERRPARASSSPPRTASRSPCVGEVDVDPAGEQVRQVPVALAVAEQDQLGHRRSYSVMPKRSRPNALDGVAPEQLVPLPRRRARPCRRCCWPSPWSAGTCCRRAGSRSRSRSGPCRWRRGCQARLVVEDAAVHPARDVAAWAGSGSAGAERFPGPLRPDLVDPLEDVRHPADLALGVGELERRESARSCPR